MVAMFGAAAATGMPRYRSNRCLPTVAAWAELPRAQVTMTRGSMRVRRWQTSASGRSSARACPATASGASAISWLIRLMGELGDDPQGGGFGAGKREGAAERVAARWRETLARRIGKPRLDRFGETAHETQAGRAAGEEPPRQALDVAPPG